MVKNLSKRILSLAAACALLLMPIFSSPVFAAEENVIPDAAFKAKLNSAIDYMRPADHDITKEELGKLTAIVTAEDLGIKSVEGIQYATKVKSLYVGNNQIADLTPISKMPQLEGLGIEKNGIKEISLLSSLKNLTALYARNNELTDIAPLASMTELKELKISGNKISDLSALKGLTKLNDVDLDNNAIYDLTPLKDCKDLKVYNFSAEKQTVVIKVDAEGEFENPLRYIDGSIPALKELSGLEAKDGKFKLADPAKAGAASFDNNKSFSGTITFEPIEKFNVTVKNGTADKAAYAEGETVKVKADKAPAGKVFDKWVVVKGDNVKFDDATKAEASFSMPANEVAVAATFKDDKKPDNNDHNATNNGADKNKGKDNSAKKTAAPSTGDNGAVPFAVAFGIMLVSLAALRKLSMKKS